MVSCDGVRWGYDEEDFPLDVECVAMMRKIPPEIWNAGAMMGKITPYIWNTGAMMGKTPPVRVDTSLNIAM